MKEDDENNVEEEDGENEEQDASGLNVILYHSLVRHWSTPSLFTNLTHVIDTQQ